MTDFLAAAIVLLSVAYAAWRVYLLLTSRQNPCDGCEGCALKGSKTRKEGCDKKKEAEKFG